MVIAVGTIVGAAILGLSVYQSSAAPADPKLSSDEVRELIEIDYPGTITEFELEEEHGKAIYDIEIEGEGMKYDLKIDGDSGQVLKNKEKQVTNKNKSENKDKDQVDVTADVKKSKPDNIISMKEAEDIALQEFSGVITELELDKDDGRSVYEIQIENGDDEAEIDIDAATGNIIELDIDFEDGDDD